MKISVITPSYNQGLFIKETINSVISQEVPELEYFVIDGGSIDETVNILKLYNDKIKWISEKDNGQASAVNKGFKLTNGEIIGWINSDDIYYPGTLKKILNLFEFNPNIDVIYGQADHIDIAGNPIEEYPSETWNIERLFDTCFICQPALFFRRTLIDRFGLLDERLNYCMDYEYWIRLALGGVRFEYINSKLSASRLYKENKTLGSRVAVHKEINEMLFTKLGSVPDRWLFNYSHVLASDIINKNNSPKIYIFITGYFSIFNALRFNKRVSINMIKWIFEWIFGVSLKNK